MYLAVTEVCVTKGELAWIPACDLLEWVAGVGDSVLPNKNVFDEEDEEPNQWRA